MASQTGKTRVLADAVASEAGRVIGLASGSVHRFSKSARDSLLLLEGLGAEGDVHAGPFVRHRYLARLRPRERNLRQIHLIPSELLEALRMDGYELGPGDLGENVLTAGLDLEILPLGTILKVGDHATVELTGLRTPCILIDKFRRGLKRKMLVDETDRPRFRCGVMAVVRSSGLVVIDDNIQVMLPSEPHKCLPAL